MSAQPSLVKTSEKASITLRDEERQVCEVWTRVMGYHRPISEFNPGKRSEYEERVSYRENPTAARIAA